MSSTQIPAEGASWYENDDQACELPNVSCAKNVLPTLTVTEINSKKKPLPRGIGRRSLSMDHLGGDATLESDRLKKIKGMKSTGKSGSLLHLNFKRSSLPVPATFHTESTASERSVDSVHGDPNSGEVSPADHTNSSSERDAASPTMSAFPFEAGTTRRKPKLVQNWSLAAQTHVLTKIVRPVLASCITCNQLLFIGGHKCKTCQLYSHNRCLKYMVITCGTRDKSGKIFGVALVDSNERVPQIIRKCVLQMEVRGSGHEGVYNGEEVTSQAKRAMRSFENASNLVDLQDTPIGDVAVILKTYLSYLPEPLIPQCVHVRFLKIATKYPMSLFDPINYHKTIVADFEVLLKELPANHGATLAFLIHHLKKVSGNHRYNQMTTEKLSTVFAPLFFQTKDPQGNVYGKIFNQSPHSRVLEMLMTHCDDIFGPIYQ